MSRRQQELNHERRWLDERLDLTVRRLEAKADQGNALQRILKAERLAAKRDSNEQEIDDVTHCEG